MQSRPVFKDVLLHGITSEQLTHFLNGLRDKDTGFHLSEQSEVNAEVYFKNPKRSDNIIDYRSALCFAVHLYDQSMVEALLKIGADQAYTGRFNNNEASPLEIAFLHIKADKMENIISLLMAAPHTDIYTAINYHNNYINLFLLARGNVEFILQIFESDPVTASLQLEEKEEISLKIAREFKKGDHYSTNLAVRASVQKIYATDEMENRSIEVETRSTEEKLTADFPINAADVRNVVLSYLFPPIKPTKPDSLKEIERLVDSWSELNPSCRIS